MYSFTEYFSIALGITDWNSLKTIRFHMRYAHDVELRFRNIRYRVGAIKDIGSWYLTREICAYVVSRDGRLLEYVPEELRDREMCATAVEHGPNAVRFIPSRLMDYNMIRSIAIFYWQDIENVPRKLLTYDICKEIVSINGKILEFVPLEYRDTEMCIAALTDSKRLRHMPEKQRNIIMDRLSAQPIKKMYLIN